MWLRDVVYRLLGREVAKRPELERADRILDRIDTIHIEVVPKNKRALEELRRLHGHARR